MNLSSNCQTEGLIEAVSFFAGQWLAAKKIQANSPVRLRPTVGAAGCAKI
jgi:hypothetical protein